MPDAGSPRPDDQPDPVDDAAPDPVDGAAPSAAEPGAQPASPAAPDLPDGAVPPEPDVAEPAAAPVDLTAGPDVAVPEDPADEAAAPAAAEDAPAADAVPAPGAPAATPDADAVAGLLPVAAGPLDPVPVGTPPLGTPVAGDPPPTVPELPPYADGAPGATAAAAAPPTAGDDATPPAAASGDGRSSRSVGRGLLAALAVAALLAVVGTAYLAWQLRETSRTETARTEALAAARDAARLLFSYDHEQLEQDFEAGLAVTTGDFREEYERTTREVVTPVATQYDAVVAAEVVEAGVVSAEPDRVVTLVYVNQTTTSTRVEGPKIDQSRVRMVLRESGDEWLVEQVDAL